MVKEGGCKAIDAGRGRDQLTLGALPLRDAPIASTAFIDVLLSSANDPF